MNLNVQTPVPSFITLIEKLEATPDGDGNQHNHNPLPVILAGRASGRLKGGRHIRNPKDTTMSNLLLAMLDKMGIRAESFGDSTGMLGI